MGRKGCCMILSLLCVWMLCDTAIAAEYLIPGGQVIGIELEDAIYAITEAPARAVKKADKMGRIAVGMPADLVMLTPDLELDAVFVDGARVV